MFIERGLSHHVRLKLTLGFPQLKDVTGESITIPTSGCKMAPMVWPLNTFTYIGGWGRRVEGWTPRCPQWLALYSTSLSSFLYCVWVEVVHSIQIYEICTGRWNTRGAPPVSYTDTACTWCTPSPRNAGLPACARHTQHLLPYCVHEWWRRDLHPIPLFLENNPNSCIPCKWAPRCPSPCPQAAQLSGLADYWADRTRMEWNIRGPRCHSRDCAGGRWVRPLPCPSAVGNTVSRVAAVCT